MTTSIIRLSVHLGLGLKAAVTVYKWLNLNDCTIRIGKKVYGRSEGGVRKRKRLVNRAIYNRLHTCLASH